MTKWQMMEEFLFAYNIAGNISFTNQEVADWFGIPNDEATSLIQAYQDAILSPNHDNLFFLAREGRTSNARWFVGENLKDLKRVTRQFGDDVQNRILVYIEPWVDAINRKNPRLSKRASRISMQIGRLIQQLEDLAA